MKIKDLLNNLYGRKGYVDTDNVKEVINEIELTRKEFNQLLQNEIVLHCTSNYGSKPESYNIYTKDGLVVATIKDNKIEDKYLLSLTKEEISLIRMLIKINRYKMPHTEKETCDNIIKVIEEEVKRVCFLNMEV